MLCARDMYVMQVCVCMDVLCVRCVLLLSLYACMFCVYVMYVNVCMYASMSSVLCVYVV